MLSNICYCKMSIWIYFGNNIIHATYLTPLALQIICFFMVIAVWNRKKIKCNTLLQILFSVFLRTNLLYINRIFMTAAAINTTFFTEIIITQQLKFSKSEGYWPINRKWNIFAEIPFWFPLKWHLPAKTIFIFRILMFFLVILC